MRELQLYLRTEVQTFVEALVAKSSQSKERKLRQDWGGKLNAEDFHRLNHNSLRWNGETVNVSPREAPPRLALGLGGVRPYISRLHEMCPDLLTTKVGFSLFTESPKALLCMVPQPMELSGLEPLTPAMPLQCSTN
jgi:hypothetical protein